MMSTNFIAEFQPQGPGNSSHNFSAEILLQPPLRISEIEKVEARKALREKRRDSCLGSHFLREQYIGRAASETTLSARAKNSDIELGGNRGRESGPASLRGESKRAGIRGMHFLAVSLSRGI